MQLIDGRTAGQWRSFDRAHLAIAFLLALLLIILALAGRGPSAAAVCCGVPEAGVAAAPAAAPAQAMAVPTAEPAEAPAPAPAADPACAGALPATALFATNGVELTADDREALDRVARCLGDRRLEVDGHADSSGSDATNERLSAGRARAAADYLASRGVARSRIETIGHGAAQPVADNATAEGRAQNRRAEVRVQ